MGKVKSIDSESNQSNTKKTLSTNSGSRLKILSYNIQVGIMTNRPHHYVTRSWRHLLPHEKHFHILDQIADLVGGYDLVGLQEVDAGSLRSSFVNQTEYIAQKAAFPFWYHQTNRRFGTIARHSNGFLSQYLPSNVEDHKLPGIVPGRGAMVVRYGDVSNPLIVVLLHLALGKRARMIQLEYIGELVSEFKHVVVMGDMNCQPDSDELNTLFGKTGLAAPATDLKTYPSWNPKRHLDHILVSPSLIVEKMEVLDCSASDHLPISMEIVVPQAVRLVA